MRKKRVMRWLQSLCFLSFLCLFASPSVARSPRLSLSGVWQSWIELLQAPEAKNLPEAQLLLKLLKKEEILSKVQRGVVPLSWFVDLCGSKLCINLTELRSQVRSFSIYANDANKWLQRGSRSSLLTYWSGGWEPWMWERALAFKLLPGLIHATARLRFRKEVQLRLGWAYPLETREELLLGLKAQAIWLSSMLKNPKHRALWDLVKVRKLDRSMKKLLEPWTKHKNKGLQQRARSIMKRSINVLSPMYDILPTTEAFHLSLSKKRPPFQLNRRRNDSLLQTPRKTLLVRIQGESNKLKTYLDFCRSRIPTKIEEIIRRRLHSMNIDTSDWQAMWYTYRWQPQLKTYYTQNLMLVPFTTKQEKNREALKILNNPSKHKNLRITYQSIFQAWFGS
ncbi:MAG: hypothetical protein EP343_19065 [Deltaproteobacteria bacterium]|nr:MAG: hypothetical protein EP343_19065 [Deltaproteobacteria bacterium]